MPCAIIQLIIGDILASHSPPHKILDKCYHGENAGCASLRGKVERMMAGPPRLWVCGHIHEGRGSEKVSFGLSTRETLVVNAANANSGRANSIRHGPVVIDFHQDENMTIIQGDGIINDAKISDEASAEVDISHEDTITEKVNEDSLLATAAVAV